MTMVTSVALQSIWLSIACAHVAAYCETQTMQISMFLSRDVHTCDASSENLKV